MNPIDSPFQSTPELAVEVRGPVLWLTITREERRNAMSHGVLAAMAKSIAAAQSQRDIRAIVVTGAGSKAFCAGADLQSANAFTTRNWVGMSSQCFTCGHKAASSPNSSDLPMSFRVMPLRPAIPRRSLPSGPKPSAFIRHRLPKAP